MSCASALKLGSRSGRAPEDELIDRNDQEEQLALAGLRRPGSRWLETEVRLRLPGDVVAGITLAAYAIPVSLAYAGLAGLPPQVGVYGYLLGGLGYALLGSSRQLAIGPTSAISLMIAGTVGAMADGDAERYAQIASLAAFTVAALSLIAWLLRLSVLVKLISDSILVGFKAGAGLTIAMTSVAQPVRRGRAVATTFSSGSSCLPRSSVRCTLHRSHRRCGRDRAARRRANACCPANPSRLELSRFRLSLRRYGAPGARGANSPEKFRRACPPLAARSLRLRDVEGIVPLAAGCLLLAYIEGVSAARAFAAKHGYALDPTARASRHRRGQSRGGDGTRLSCRRRPVAIGGERQGWRAHGARAGLCLDHARVVPALPDGPVGEPSESGAGGCRFDCCVWVAGFPRDCSTCCA